MQVKRLFYDIVNNLVPGIVALTALYVVHHHSEQCHQPIFELRELVLTLLPFEIIVLLFVAYFISHFLSSLTTLFFEGFLLRMSLLARFTRDSRILGPNLYKAFVEKFQKTFGFEPGPKDFPACVIYVEAGQPAIYSSAVLFESFCGLAGNLTFILILYSLSEVVSWFIFGNLQSLQYVAIVIPITLVAFYHYLRLLRCYKLRILLGFIVSQDKNP